MVREHRHNNLHPDSIAMENPHFNRQFIFPSSPQSPKAPSHNMKIPELRGTPIDVALTVVPNLEVQTLNWVHRTYIGIEWPLEREIPFYPVAIGLLKQTLEEGLEGMRMESAMIRMTRLNWVWFITVISLDQNILSVLSPSLLYSKNSYLFLLQMVSPRKLQFHNLIIAQVQPSVVDGSSSMPPNGA